MTSVIRHPTALGPVTTLAGAHAACRSIYDGAIVLIAGYANSGYYGAETPLPQEQVFEASGPGTRLQGTFPLAFSANGSLSSSAILAVPFTIQYINASQFRLQLTSYSLSTGVATLQGTYMAVNDDWSFPGKPVNVRYPIADNWSAWEFRFDAQWRINGLAALYFGESNGFMWAREDNFLATDRSENADATPSNGRVYAPYILRFAPTSPLAPTGTGTGTGTGTSSGTGSGTALAMSGTGSSTASATASRTLTITATRTNTASNSASATSSSSSSSLSPLAIGGIAAGALVLLVLIIVLVRRRGK